MRDTAQPASSPWFVYLVRNAAGQLYTGISTDPERRMREHEHGVRGARALRGKGPLTLVFQAEAGSRSTASQLEARIKKLPRARKLQLLSGELCLQALSEPEQQGRQDSSVIRRGAAGCPGDASPGALTSPAPMAGAAAPGPSARKA